MQAGKAVRPYRADGYVNLMNRYGTTKDTTERYRFQPEPVIPDDLLTMYYAEYAGHAPQFFHSDDPFSLEAGGVRLALGKNLAEKISVEQERADG